MNSREVEKGNATNSCLTRQIYTFLIDINNFEEDLSHSKACTSRTYFDFIAVDHTPQNWHAPFLAASQLTSSHGFNLVYVQRAGVVQLTITSN